MNSKDLQIDGNTVARDFGRKHKRSINGAITSNKAAQDSLRLPLESLTVDLDTFERS